MKEGFPRQKPISDPHPKLWEITRINREFRNKFGHNESLYPPLRPQDTHMPVRSFKLGFWPCTSVLGYFKKVDRKILGMKNKLVS